MSGYVGNSSATAKALSPDGWYTNLGDVCFRLRNPADGAYDYYWMSRDSALLIRGGANYAYEQVRDVERPLRTTPTHRACSPRLLTARDCPPACSPEQINAEIKAFLVKTYDLAPEEVEVAVLGKRIDSEHEDSCCVTIELAGAAEKKTVRPSPPSPPRDAAHRAMQTVRRPG